MIKSKVDLIICNFIAKALIMRPFSNQSNKIGIKISEKNQETSQTGLNLDESVDEKRMSQKDMPDKGNHSITSKTNFLSIISYKLKFLLFFSSKNS